MATLEMELSRSVELGSQGLEYARLAARIAEILVAEAVLLLAYPTVRGILLGFQLKPLAD